MTTLTEKTIPTETENIQDARHTSSAANHGIVVADESERKNSDQDVVDFDSDDDPENPLSWSLKYKWGITVMISLMTLVVNISVIICAPAAPQILSAFHETRAIDGTIIVSIWELGEVIGPFIIAPLSELYGRVPVYNVANVLFIIFTIGGALSTNLGMMIAFRFLNGMTVASLNLNASIVGDMFPRDQRGRALTVMGIAPKIGPVAGPIIGGYLAQADGWRWTFWIATILTGAFEIVFLAFYRETYKPQILKQKARRLRKETGNLNLRSRYHTKLTKSQFLLQGIIRPMRMFFSPIVLLLSIYVAFVYGYIYLLITTITEVFEGTYGFSEGPAGLVFIGIGLGMTIGLFFCGFTLDWYVKKKAKKGEVYPEDRLPPMVVGGLLIPIGLFIYGWTAQNHVAWIVPIISTAIGGFGLTVTTVPVSSYLVDAFGIHAASAIAASTVLKQISGAVLPLAGPPLYSKLGLGWGNSVLGFVALAFVPMPSFLIVYGKRIRESSFLRVKVES